MAHSVPFEVLDAAARSTEQTVSVFSWLRIGFDSTEPPQRRCHAIEQLAKHDVTVSPILLRRLLECQDGTVARYALGLADIDAGERSVLSIAEGCLHAGDHLFKAELDLLKQLSHR
jgi:hypothetical protein